MARRDPSLDTLLDLHGQVLVIDEAGYWVSFVVHEAPVSAEKPHGLDYSLTLHDPGGERLVGFDNAHRVAGKRRAEHDHKHRLRHGAAVRLPRCGGAGGGFLGRSRGRDARTRSLVMKTLKVGIASYEDMKARTLAIAKGELKPAAGEPKVWFTSPESFAKLLSNRNRALLAVIADTRPASLQELAANTGRTPGNLSRTLRTMERYGLVRLHKGERGALRPEVPYRDVQLEMSLC